jgi:hypothetical protein
MTVQKLIKREQKRQDHAYIRKLIKNKNSKGVTILEIPNSINPLDWDQIFDPEIIESLLFDKNIDHFSQANESPFCQPPVVDVFGYEGVNDDVVDIITKQQIPITLRNQPEYVRLILEKLSNGENLPTISDGISFEEYCQGFKKWSEKTTTSPSGRHLATTRYY